MYMLYILIFRFSEGNEAFSDDDFEEAVKVLYLLIQESLDSSWNILFALGLLI